jgi:hypothetical protein
MRNYPQPAPTVSATRPAVGAPEYPQLSATPTGTIRNQAATGVPVYPQPIRNDGGQYPQPAERTDRPGARSRRPPSQPPGRPPARGRARPSPGSRPQPHPGRPRALRCSAPPAPPPRPPPAPPAATCPVRRPAIARPGAPATALTTVRRLAPPGLSRARRRAAGRGTSRGARRAPRMITLGTRSTITTSTVIIIITTGNNSGTAKVWR